MRYNITLVYVLNLRREILEKINARTQGKIKGSRKKQNKAARVHDQYCNQRRSQNNRREMELLRVLLVSMSNASLPEEPVAFGILLHGKHRAASAFFGTDHHNTRALPGHEPFAGDVVELLHFQPVAAAARRGVIAIIHVDADSYCQVVGLRVAGGLQQRAPHRRRAVLVSTAAFHDEHRRSVRRGCVGEGRGGEKRWRGNWAVDGGSRNVRRGSGCLWVKDCFREEG